MNVSVDSDAILRGLNESKVKELTPLFTILGVLMFFGLLGNTSVLIFIWPRAKQSISSFFIQILAVVDILVCLTISFAIFNYSTIYMFTNSAVCKIYVFSKFCTANFSGFVLITVAAYRYRKICRPVKKQLSLRGAKIAVGCGVFVVLAVSIPQLFLLETVNMEVPNNINVTLLGSDCVTQVLENDSLKAFATGLEALYLICFVGASITLFIIYSLIGRAIYLMNKNRVKLRQNSIRGRSKSFTDHTDVYNKSRDYEQDGDDPSDTNTVTKSSMKKADSVIKESTRYDRADTDNSGLVSMAKVTIMFFIISLGFVLTFLPYISYALWRTFQASKSDVLFTTKPQHLFGLNSYIINSVINPIIYAVFNVQYREFLGRCLCKCRKSVNKEMASV